MSYETQVTQHLDTRGLLPAQYLAKQQPSYFLLAQQFDLPCENMTE